MNLLIVIKFCEQFSWALSNFFADVSSKIITLANPALSQPDMLKQKWFLLRRRVYSLICNLPRMVGPSSGAIIPEPPGMQ
jgi:hypothetical protein